MDTAITTYLLETSDRWMSACIVSSDADFVPPVRSLKRRGKQVFCAAEPGGGTRDLAQVCTSHHEFDVDFLSRDLATFLGLVPGGHLDRELAELRGVGDVTNATVTLGRGTGFQARITLKIRGTHDQKGVVLASKTRLKEVGLDSDPSNINWRELEAGERRDSLVVQINPPIGGRMTFVDEGTRRHALTVSTGAAWRAIAEIDDVL